MLESNGLITIAFKRALITEARVRADTDLPKMEESKIRNMWLTSPYCQIEPAMAYQLGLPILILRETGIIPEGLFEKGVVGTYIYSSNTNISFFHSADEFETIRQQGTQFALIFARISEEFLTSGFEFGKRFEVLVVQGFLLEEFPEAFDQIQIRRIGREEYELDA